MQPRGEDISIATDFAVDPTDADRIYLVSFQLPSRLLVSTDAGVTFSTLFTFPSPASTPTRIAVSSDGATIYVLCDTAVFRSTDRGSSFQQRSGVGDDSFTVLKAVVDPADADTLYVLRNDQLQVTHDGAGSWAKLAPATFAFTNDFAIDPADPNTLWLATHSDLRRSTDRGASWTVVLSDYVTAVGLDLRTPVMVYASVFNGRVFRGNGSTWTNVTDNLDGLGGYAIAVSPFESNRLILANTRGLWMSATTGRNWISVARSMTAPRGI